MQTALALSPHLDDAVFSCGGRLAQLADSGWRVIMATAFTRTIHPATGFALACQLDKGLPPDADYMHLRRTEDRAAAALIGAEPLHLDLPEAPHRGYGSAPALFAQPLPNDDIWRPLAEIITALAADLRPALILAPQGLGNHVDHHQLIRALHAAAVPTPLAFYRDTPYAIRNPAALRNVTLEGTLIEETFGIAAGLDRKIAAASAYTSQVGFQFGGPGPGLGGVEAALRAFALREGDGQPAERFLVRQG